MSYVRGLTVLIPHCVNCMTNDKSTAIYHYIHPYVWMLWTYPFIDIYQDMPYNSELERWNLLIFILILIVMSESIWWISHWCFRNINMYLNSAMHRSKIDEANFCSLYTHKIHWNIFKFTILQINNLIIVSWKRLVKWYFKGNIEYYKWCKTEYFVSLMWW